MPTLESCHPHLVALSTVPFLWSKFIGPIDYTNLIKKKIVPMQNSFLVRRVLELLGGVRTRRVEASTFEKTEA